MMLGGIKPRSLNRVIWTFIGCSKLKKKDTPINDGFGVRNFLVEIVISTSVAESAVHAIPVLAVLRREVS
jgi:hypothetical protein